MTRTKQERLTRAFGQCIVFMIVAIAVEAVVRCVFIANYVPLSLFSDNMGHIPLLMLNALRFDAQIEAYAVLPLLLCALVNLFCKFGTEGFFRWYSPIVLTLIAIIGFADIQFYGNFNSHFNNVTFDFFDEEPAVLIKGIVSDAPLLKIIVGSVVIFLLVRWLTGRLYAAACRRISRKRMVFFIVFTLLVVPVSLRGSLGTFTLRAEDVYVSPSAQLNDCVPSPIYMMKKAWSEKKKQFKIVPEDELLKAEGFKDIGEACRVLGYATDNIDSVLFVTTSERAPFDGCNVVFVLTESWSNRLIDYESMYNLDLLGAMRQHIDNDLIFRHFLSSTNGTIDAVESLTVSSIFPHLFTSAYRDVPYTSATARVFRDCGYHTEFISGIELAWRNLMEVLPNQGFDKVTGKYEILGVMPDAECNRTWGVYDHSMLEYVLNELSDTTLQQPKFLFCLTSTSHTPFEFPEGYPMPALDLTQVPDAAFAVGKSTAEEYLKGYQYESMALGNFMSALKASPMARNTVVAITGDHNIRLILPSADGDWWRYSVPLYLYLPDRDKVVADTTRYGSHGDVVPTLASLTLSGGRYFRSGKNLLADSIAGGTYGVNVSDTIFSPDSDVALQRRRLEALRALQKIYFERQFLTKNEKNSHK